MPCNGKKITRTADTQRHNFCICQFRHQLETIVTVNDSDISETSAKASEHKIYHKLSSVLENTAIFPLKYQKDGGAKAHAHVHPDLQAYTEISTVTSGSHQRGEADFWTASLMSKR